MHLMQSMENKKSFLADAMLVMRKNVSFSKQKEMQYFGFFNAIEQTMH